ncbi:E3 ubiquitin/ISG15 ligase TRIM25-like [Hyla sarda]|uniref:E3 ubiquitin/ISG15 ligase TRIM25-like n=1 Tax=Hyla sarda TaxID=327740 RepID=UPI0024C256CC|nr:E3 ubiquitin/ISG15 ligase TRIM25-like [Hyla sarda]
MAAMADLREELLCSLCLNLYTDPVSLRCGHNFCRDCIEKVFQNQNRPGDCKCPNCRRVFWERPELQRNITLCNIVERLQVTEQQGFSVTCTYCVHLPVPAVKSCVMCEASLCELHLNVHSKAPEHVLTNPTQSLENRRCPTHRKILEYYCTEDATCICVSCRLDGQHGEHRIQTLQEAGEKKKEEIRHLLQELKTKKEEMEKRIKRLEIHRRNVKERSAKAKKKVAALFEDLTRRLEDLETKLHGDISQQEAQVSLSVTDQIRRLEEKKDEIAGKMSSLEELCSMADPVTLLQERLSDNNGVSDTEEEEDGEELGDLDVELISEALRSGLSHILSDRKDVVYVSEAVDISLDVDTAGNSIEIAGNLKILSWTKNTANRQQTAQRFQYSQVLSVQSFSAGRHYWDVESSKWGDWRIGVSYASAARHGDLSWIGHNRQSWCLRRRNEEYTVRHDNEDHLVPHRIMVLRFRVHLDYEAGQLSFYELCDPMRLLYTFTASFTEPLHAAFYLWEDVYGRRSCLRIITET